MRGDALARRIVLKKNGNPDNPDELAAVWEEAKTASAGTGLGDQVEALEVLAERYGVLEDEDAV